MNWHSNSHQFDKQNSSITAGRLLEDRRQEITKNSDFFTREKVLRDPTLAQRVGKLPEKYYNNVG